MDPRYAILADNLTGYSISLKRGEKVLIDAFDVPDDIVVALIRSVRKRKGIPFVKLNHSRIGRELLMGANEHQYATLAKHELSQMKDMDAYIALRGSLNIFETSDVPTKKMQVAMSQMRPVQNWRVGKTKWVVLRWPTPSMAQQSLSSTEKFEDFFFDVCCMDYARMLPGQRALKRLMDRTDKVELKGPGTDLRFSIKGIESVMCAGTYNIPDGEVFTAPVRKSVEGVVTYNAPTVYQGVSFDNVRFEFSEGRIVKASCTGDQRKLKQILDSDEGARYIGEFAIGFNPHIKEPMRDILFDEKIAGSFHFTPGQAYEGLADNGNRSQIHWDIVNIQRPEYGGGEIWFDGKLIRKDGLFVPKSLHKLNPEYLLG
ncbi:MAG: aminopeptidase [Opitutales bacterium]|nr:aminopeptidase [Opitutales bacterium]